MSGLARCISENVHTLKAQGLQTCLSQQHHIVILAYTVTVLLHIIPQLAIYHLACDYCENVCIVIIIIDLPRTANRGPHGEIWVYL